MGRDDDDSRKRSRSRDKERKRRDREHNEDHKRRDDRETEEERLLRKAKEFIEKQSVKQDGSDEGDKNRSRRDHERRSRHRKDDRHTSRDRDSSRKHDKQRDEEKRSRKDRADHDDDDRKHSRRSRDDRKSRKKHQNHHHRRKDSGSDDKKKHKHDSKEKKKERKDRPKRVDKSQLTDMGPVRGNPPEQLLDAQDDYYALHQHFLVYLFREEGTVFSAVKSTKDARKAFSRFVQAYNSGNLEQGYYQALPPAGAIEESTQKQHSWSFQTSRGEEKQLHMLQAGIRKQTEYQQGDSIGPMPDSTAATAPSPTSLPNDTYSCKGQDPKDRAAQRTANRRLREHVRVVNEELTGGSKDFRERQLEKKKAQADRVHGAARAKDGDSMVELTDDALYGQQDKNSFERAVQREKARSSRREQEKKSRLEELQQKEKDKQEAMFKLLGIKPGQKITIASRKDGAS